MNSRDPNHFWNIFADTGGTFTDAIGVDPSGATHRVKVLSTGALRARVLERLSGREVRIASPWPTCDDLITGFAFRGIVSKTANTVTGFRAADGAVRLVADDDVRIGETVELQSPFEAPILAARLLTRTPAIASLPPIHMRLATTRATNALLERSMTPTVFIVTEGFADLLLIGDQHRDDLFAIDVRKPTPLYGRVIEVRERLGADGHELKALDEESLAAAAVDAIAQGFTAAAVCLLHADLNPSHERQVEAILRRAGFSHVSVSSTLARRPGSLLKAQTIVTNAALSGAIESYLDRVGADLHGGTLRVMTSAGGLVGRHDVRAVDMLLSGPAGGVIGALAAGRASGFEKLIGIDMGGTSTDVARINGEVEMVFTHRVDQVQLSSPSILIESIAAGGGSICWIDGARLRLGPKSAGANPGPACYGMEGPLTLTDVNLLLGRIDANAFEIPLDTNAPRLRLKELLTTLNRDDSASDEVLRGFIDVANERMAEAIRTASVRRGFEPSEYALLAFGGAGGLHACALADRLGMPHVILPRDAGLLSAKGLQSARVERSAFRVVNVALEGIGSWDELFRSVESESLDLLRREGIEADHAAITRRIVEMRLEGQESSLAVEFDGDPLERYRLLYAKLFGEEPKGRKVIVDTVRVFAAEVEHAAATAARAAAMSRQVSHSPSARAPNVIHRELLQLGDNLEGPALIVEPHCTSFIEAGWSGQIDEQGAIVLRRTTAAGTESMAPEAAFEVDICRLESIAADMGEMLRRTAVSTNVKERLDYSCAVLDAAGELIVNAPHVPVHLGSLGVCVRQVLKTLAITEGDVVVTNHPAHGGSHLPDVTVITAAFDRDGAIIGYLAARAHHAEIGGIMPGSMPPHATRLSQEGVVIPPMLVVRGGQSRLDDVAAVLNAGDYPSRAVADNLADLRAAVAAVRLGAEALSALAQGIGRDRLTRHCEMLKSRAAVMVGHALEQLDPPMRRAEEALDDGTRIVVQLDATTQPARLSFHGTDPVHSGNLNATEAIARSVVLYVLRLLVGERLPLNEGFMRAVEVILPPNCFLNPEFAPDADQCPAVGAGNTETSQRVANLLIQMLDLASSSQGTMNNVVFGNERFGFYETVGGGTGAGEGFQGADAVHSHMTNTRLTDVELLERRYPVRIERFSIRRDSGGIGGYQGGDGIVREYRFLEAVSLAVIGQHRVNGPPGSHGGEAGSAALQTILRVDGSSEALRSSDSVVMRAGDRLLLETPGGGGWGVSTER